MRLFDFNVLNTELTLTQLIWTSDSSQSSFQSSVEINSHLIWCCITTHNDIGSQSLHPFVIQLEIKPKPSIWLRFWLDYYVSPLWLTIMITMVLVLWHSTETLLLLAKIHCSIKLLFSVPKSLPFLRYWLTGIWRLHFVFLKCWCPNYPYWLPYIWLCFCRIP